MRWDVQQHGIVLEAEVRACTIEVYLNGIPLGLCGVGTSTKLARPVHEFLVDGRNELAILVNPGDTPADALQPSTKPKPADGAQPPSTPELDSYQGVEDEPGEAENEVFSESLKEEEEEESEEKDDDARKKEQHKEGDEAPTTLNELTDRDFWIESRAALDGGDDGGKEHMGLAVEPTAVCMARLCKYRVGAMSFDGSGERLIQVAWSAKKELDRLAAAHAPFPRWVRIDRNFGQVFGPLHWQSADPLKLDDATRSGARQFVLQVRQAIEEGQADPVLNASQQRFEEVAQAYAISAKERAAMFRQLLSTQSPKPEWMFETPEDEDFSLRLAAEARLIECTGPDWLPIVRGVKNPETGRFMYPMFIGRAKGRWLIMR